MWCAALAERSGKLRRPEGRHSDSTDIRKLSSLPPHNERRQGVQLRERASRD